MKFRYKSKYGGDCYFGYVDYIIHDIKEVSFSFYATNGVAYKINEVEWVEDIREEQLKKLGI